MQRATKYVCLPTHARATCNSAIAAGGSITMNAHRPVVMGTRHAISAGHYLAAEAGFEIFNAGGNAIDAGVAAGLAIGVLQTDLVNIAGVAPIMPVER